MFGNNRVGSVSSNNVDTKVKILLKIKNIKNCLSLKNQILKKSMNSLNNLFTNENKFIFI